MAYTDIISVEDAKDYLGVDDTSRDAEIARLIKSALKYLEKRTNIIMQEVVKIYPIVDGCVRVYDSPIITASFPSSTTRTKKSLYSLFEDNELTEISLTVGSIDVDSDLVEAGYMLIEHYFQEGDRSKLPLEVENIINMNKRFVV